MIDLIITLFNQKLLPFLYAMLGFGTLVTVHEFGHFFFCKLFGIHTPTFSIGFGPELVSKKIGSTHFRLALLPLGGYVEIAGHSEVGQGSQEFAQAQGPTSFNDKSYWQKFLVLTGGIFFNLLFSYFVFTALFLMAPSSRNQGLEIAMIVPDSAAEKSGLKKDDCITHINQTTLLTETGELKENAPELFLQETRLNPHKQIELKILRNAQEEKHSITLGSRSENGLEIGTFGAAFKRKKLTFIPALLEGARETVRWITTIAQSISNLFSKRSLDGAGGPLMIIASSFSTAQEGSSTFLLFLAIISINLALINLLPFGIVDGGQLLFVTIEAIIRRPLPEMFKLVLNLISLACVALLFAYLTYKDILTLFGTHIFAFYTKIKSLF